MHADILSLHQCPAMPATVTAAWLVVFSHQRKRQLGFWVYLHSSLLWVTKAPPDGFQFGKIFARSMIYSVGVYHSVSGGALYMRAYKCGLL